MNESDTSLANNTGHFNLLTTRIEENIGERNCCSGDEVLRSRYLMAGSEEAGDEIGNHRHFWHVAGITSEQDNELHRGREE